MSEQDGANAPARLTPKEALAKRQAEHLAWKQQFFHRRPPPACLGRLHRRQASPIGRSVADSFKRARELVHQTAPPAQPEVGEVQPEAAAVAEVRGPSTAVDEDFDTLPPPLRRRREWCTRLQHELSTRNPSTDVQIRSDPRRTLVLSHLHTDTSEAELRVFAEQLGHVESVRLIRDTRSGASRRYAFLELRFLADATKAVQLSGKKRLHGRVVTIDLERGRTQAGFVPQRFAAAAKYDDAFRVTDPAEHTAQPTEAPSLSAQNIKAMSEDDFLNAMLNL